jgi:thiamine pyrophosphate-dependent acetolactate synthase large subunit-like protein
MLKPGSFFAGCIGGLGTGTGTALGVKAAFNYGYHSQKSGVPRFFPDGFAVRNQDFIGISINPSPDYATVARAFDGYGEKVEEPSEVRAALQRGLKAIAGGQFALIDVRLAKAAETNERPDRAN